MGRCIEIDEKFWAVPEMWKDQTCFIIGGGPSLCVDAGLTREEIDNDGGLKKFSEFFSPIHGKRVIGTNDAYKLGHWVDICAFGDYGWYLMHRDRSMDNWLLDFPNIKVTCARQLINKKHAPEKIFILARRPCGLHMQKRRIGWNKNTGGMSVNLALKLGCSRIVCLGFDMKCRPTDNPRDIEKLQSNWHINKKNGPRPDNYKKCFLKYFDTIADEMNREFPDVEMFVHPKDSALKRFPRITWDEAVELAKG